MTISRRKFIGAATAAGMLSLSGIAAGQEREAAAMDGLKAAAVATDALARLSWQDFYQYQNTDFTFSKLGVSKTSLRLSSMQDSRPEVYERPTGMTQENFVLKFSSSSRTVLKQDTYDVNHFRLGNFKLFITVGGVVDGRQYYIAVINRVTS